MTKRAKVIVVGAGPVGSTAAYRLAQNGIDVILLEAHPNCPEDLRASTFHPPSLEMLSEFGIVDDLREIGLEFQSEEHDQSPDIKVRPSFVIGWQHSQLEAENRGPTHPLPHQ